MVGRWRVSFSLVGAMVLVLCLPAAALAATSTWDQPANFTAVAPGANPDHDAYGGHPWRYAEGARCLEVVPGICLNPPSTDPTLSSSTSLTFNAAPPRTGWSDAADPGIFLGTDTTVPGQLVLQPAADRTAVLGWASPLSASADVSVSLTVTATSGSPCFNWYLYRDNNQLQTGSGSTSGAVTQGATVTPGDQIYVVIARTAAGSAACSAAAVHLEITAPGVGPTVTLATPGPAPLTTATPSLSGVASTAAGDIQTVNVAIYTGSVPTSTPLRYLTGAVHPNGTFSIPVTPALPDGDYAAIAAQRGSTTTGYSNVVTFRIKVHAPALTLTNPAPGANVPTLQPTFTGNAGANPGDAATVSVAIHAGSTANGRTVGRGTAPVRGGHWSLRSPARLALGIYDLVVSQSDDAGHTTTVITTFVVVLAPRVIGARVTLSGTRVALAVACTAGSGTTCRGTVLVLTTRRLQTRPGGPVGPVRLLFAYVSIAGGHSQTVQASLPAYVAQTLRGVHHLQVRVTVSLSGQSRSTALRTVS